MIARELYALLTPSVFRLLNNPNNANNTPLSHTEQATIDTCLAREKHYFMSMWNIERVCFTSFNASINNAFKVSNNPAIQGWHAGMQVINILDQLSTIYCQLTPVILQTNNTMFLSPYLAANAPEVLFHYIKECAEMALLGPNPYTDWQLVTNAIHLFLTTQLYTRLFKEWDQLVLRGQTWIAL